MFVRNPFTLLFFGLLSVFSFTANADTPTPSHAVLAPPCLIKKLDVAYKTLAATHKFTLIETNEDGIEKLALLKHQQKNVCGGFMDVTAEWKAFNATSLSKNHAAAFLSDYDKPVKRSVITVKPTYGIRYETAVNALLKQVNPQNMWNNLTTLTNMENRNASTDHGKEAANWIAAQMTTLAKNTGHNDVSVYFVETSGYKQPSVVAKIGASNDPGIVIGAHLDTIAFGSSKQPGADDDGTGTITVLETAKVLLSSGMHFKKPIYFIWYAAEEVGLVGSKAVVTDFKKKNIPVDAVMQFDLTGYAYNNESTMWLMTDYVDNDLTNYLETLINTYVKRPVKRSQCGYACSDHANWYKSGFTASLPAEAAYENTNPNIHKIVDTMDKLSLTHMTDYAKLAVAFAVELAEPVA